MIECVGNDIRIHCDIDGDKFMVIIHQGWAAIYLHGIWQWSCLIADDTIMWGTAIKDVPLEVRQYANKVVRNKAFA